MQIVLILDKKPLAFRPSSAQPSATFKNLSQIKNSNSLGILHLQSGVAF
jgi:hypothetical protein